MSFSSDWLDLRHAADACARNRVLQEKLCACFSGRTEPLKILDLGSGTGANMRLLAPALPCPQDWTLVDNDADLLDRVTPPDSRNTRITTHVCDLGEGSLDLLHKNWDLITASAFFDLTGPAIVEDVIAATTRAGACFYTVLTYDGRETWSPDHPLDATVLKAFHDDQRRDKGLGPALGPDATDYMQQSFAARGFTVHIGQSDWQLSQETDAGLIAALAEGSATAVRATLGNAADQWRAARQTADGVMIGHQDLLALPG